MSFHVPHSHSHPWPRLFPLSSQLNDKYGNSRTLDIQGNMRINPTWQHSYPGTPEVRSNVGQITLFGVKAPCSLHCRVLGVVMVITTGAISLIGSILTCGVVVNCGGDPWPLSSERHPRQKFRFHNNRQVSFLHETGGNCIFKLFEIEGSYHEAPPCYPIHEG